MTFIAQLSKNFPDLLRESLVLRIIFVWLILGGIQANAQIIISDPDALLERESIDSMFDQALMIAASKRNAQVDFQYSNIVHNRQEWYLLLDGHFDVFVWKGGKWINTYRKDDLGYNFLSTKFTSGDKIYSYGGYGFWRLPGELISYDHSLSEWIISRDFEVMPKGVCIPGHEWMVIVSGNELSTLDLKTGRVNTCIVDIVSHFQLRSPTFTLIGKNYSVFLEENLQLLVEMPENNIYTLKMGDLHNVHLTRKEDCIHIREDSIIIYDSDFQEKLRESLRVNFDQYTLVECPEGKSSISIWKSVFLLILLLGTVLTVLISKRKKSAKKIDQVSIDTEALNISPFDKIIKAAGSTLTQDELDLIFEIPNDISPESKRFRRASMITDINTKSKLLHAKEIILRIKDPVDKRKYLYYIEL